MIRQVNKAGIDLIRAFEGERLTVYADPIGLPTVGVGHLVKPADSLKLGDRITPEHSMQLLRQDLRSAILSVQKMVIVPLTDNQFAALASFVFNLGGGNFSRSTLLRKLNAQDYAGASQEFAKWNKAGGRVLKGLIRRRAAEAALFRALRHQNTPLRA